MRDRIKGPKLFEGHGVAAEPSPDSIQNVGEYMGFIKSFG